MDSTGDGGGGGGYSNAEGDCASLPAVSVTSRDLGVCVVEAMRAVKMSFWL